ncbi:ankyrin repeat domain-containing protein [Arthrobacter sp. FW305-BF8]|uniref:ankyrin repeat domain-containing protein n=1 Tax=Arthrobacter sp. FW305-BF8 TaxID=2879617 RepID=UPI001F30D973|nr:ankyrin repeat domain-containing protein [Arthrobacter sp. FW305-BF8]UKA54922.1 ankyrin repeat domain-containing protein [Arthrobacter sp. FW305-BF8]
MVKDRNDGGRPASAFSLAGLAVLVASLLAGCSGAPSAGDPAPASSGPVASAQGSRTTSGGSGASGTARPPSSPPAAAPPALSPAEQQKLDQRLVLAAKANDAALVAQLIREGGNVNAKDSIQDSAFLYAGAEGFNEILRLTLAHGADVRSTNRFGGTALIPASEHGHVETVRILIAAGVAVNHVNNLGWTAMQEAILLNNGGTRQQDVVRQLLDAGADPNIRDPQGRTALENAERLGFVEIARLIRSRS